MPNVKVRVEIEEMAKNYNGQEQLTWVSKYEQIAAVEDTKLLIKQIAAVVNE